jgi:nicotinamidase-related amidase
MHTLVIIDMQRYFSASLDKSLVKPILREINLSKRNNWPIIMVEYINLNGKSYGKTLPFISKSLKDYSRKVTVKKCRDDGSREISAALRKLTRSKSVRIVGVNTLECVRLTAQGLVDKNYNVTIIFDGCNSSYMRHNDTVRVLKYHKFNLMRLTHEQRTSLFN